MNPLLRRVTTATLLSLSLAFPAYADFQGELTQQQAQERIKAGTITVIDVRSDHEFSAGHVPGAINLPHDSITSHLDQISHLKDKPVLLYCRSGRRAGMAEVALSEQGFRQLYHLQGDMVEWEKNQLPVEK